MSEARNQRFEIDIDEIERQLRKSADLPAQPKHDPLAELARIVGQNDPFQGILSGTSRAGVPPANVDAQTPQAFQAPQASQAAQAPEPAAYAPPHHGEAPSAADPYRERHERGEDPAVHAYAPDERAAPDEEFQPLRRRPSRAKLVAVVGALAAGVGAVAVGLTWKKSGGFLSTGAPPVIVADRSPLKVAPENPGGVEVPNQDRQIYSREQKDAQSRVVDGREQPVDVRAAVPALAPRQPAAAPDRGPSVADALGDPKRVRTVAVNPDGTSYGAPPATPMANATQNLIPSGNLPAPVPVQTVAVPMRTGSTAPAAAVAPPPAAPPATATAAPSLPAVAVLPPRRPKIDATTTEAPTRTASLPAPADAAKPKPAEAPKPAADKPAAGAKSFSVQIAVRSTEQEARTAWDQAQEKFGSSLDSRPARLTSAEVNGRTVHRVRLGPMTKPEADGMCARLKAKGGNCFVAQN